jgi:hypothetical protein
VHIFEVKSSRGESEMRRILKILLLFVVGLDAIDLQCTFKKMNWTYTFGTGCEASKVNITSQQTITSVNGQSNFNGSHCKIFDIDDEVVNFVPEGLKNFFPYIEGLGIPNLGLKKSQRKICGHFQSSKCYFCLTTK